MSSKDVLLNVLKELVDKDKFRFLVDQKVTPIKPAASR